MSRVRLYSGRFDPDCDTPVKDGLSLTAHQFGRLPLLSQDSLKQAAMSMGDPGVPDPDWHVPPMCRRGISMAELEKIYESSDARIRDGVSRMSSHDRFTKKVQNLQQSVEVNSQ